MIMTEKKQEREREVTSELYSTLQILLQQSLLYTLPVLAGRNQLSIFHNQSTNCIDMLTYY
jgi:hypothetical protein